MKRYLSLNATAIAINPSSDAMLYQALFMKEQDCYLGGPSKMIASAGPADGNHK